MMAEYKGIDVSRYQGTIDWAKVKADGIQFAILRCGTGYNGSTKDSKFETNYANAKKVGMPIGAYIYSYAKTVAQAEKEAEKVLEWIKGKSFEYPIVFDIEDKCQANLGKAMISNIIRAFCEKIECAGYYAMVYANKDWLENRIDDDCKTKYDIWLAQWTSKPSYKGEFGVWQYSSKGSVKGISGNVDMNMSYKNYPNIMKNNGINGFAKPTKTETKAPVKTESKPIAKSYKKGDAVKFTKKPLFLTASSKKAIRNVTGTYYIYDGVKINGRYRITNKAKNCGKKPIGLYVTGFVEL